MEESVSTNFFGHPIEKEENEERVGGSRNRAGALAWGRTGEC